MLIASKKSRYDSNKKGKWLLKLIRTKRMRESERQRDFLASDFQDKRCHMCSKEDARQNELREKVRQV